MASISGSRRLVKLAFQGESRAQYLIQHLVDLDLKQEKTPQLAYIQYLNEMANDRKVQAKCNEYKKRMKSLSKEFQMIGMKDFVRELVKSKTKSNKAKGISNAWECAKEDVLGILSKDPVLKKINNEDKLRHFLSEGEDIIKRWQWDK